MDSESVTHTKSKYNPDLRRRQARSAADRVLARAEFLPPDDRALIEAVYARGQTVQAVARLAAAATGRQPTPGECRVLRRRVRRLLTRLADPLFAYVAVSRGRWSPTMRRIAEECVLAGRSQRDAAVRLALSYHTVRRTCHALEAMARADSPRDTAMLAVRARSTGAAA